MKIRWYVTTNDNGVRFETLQYSTDDGATWTDCPQVLAPI